MSGFVKCPWYDLKCVNVQVSPFPVSSVFNDTLCLLFMLLYDVLWVNKHFELNWIDNDNTEYKESDME